MSLTNVAEPNRAPQNVVMEIDESTLNGEIATLKVSWKVMHRQQRGAISAVGFSCVLCDV